MDPLLLIVFGVLVVVAVGIIVAVFVMARRDTGLSDRLEDVTSAGELAEVSVEEGIREREERTFDRLADEMDKALARRGFGAGISDQLAQANLRLTVTEYLIITIFCVVGVAVGANFLFGGWVFGILGGFVGYFLPRMYVGSAKRGRLKKFNDQLGDCINLMVNGLRSGYSMLQAMETVARELPPPISEEFSRVVQEVGLGLTSEQSLNNMLRRIPSDDLDLMITAVNVQHEVGGNLAEILDIISFTIRERVRIKGEIRTLTAQAQLSGYIISGLPIALGFLLFLMNRDYMMGMFRHTCGLIMVGVALFGIVVGFVAMKKITAIEV
jgi:tight adherence protein B